MHPPLPGLVPSPAILFDERRRPDFRDVFGALARRSTDILAAVTRIRLTTLDLGTEELAPLQSLRVLLCELSALRLEAEANALAHQRRRAPNLRLLAHLLEDGRLQVRSAPLGGWSPDFTVFADGTGAQWVLTGFHAFERPYPHRGPALASLHGPEAARLAAARHQELWDAAHDVGPTVWTLLSRAGRLTGMGRAAAGG
jgi:hypothetical protein